MYMDADENTLNIILEEESEIFSLIVSGLKKHLIIPVISEPEPNNYILSRFLAKCAYEYLVLRAKEENFGKFSEYLKEEQFQPLRKYARYGEGCKIWSYSQRRIYGEGDLFSGFNREEPYETLNEMDFLFIESGRKIVDGEEYVDTELYYILVIMGIEYVISVSEPNISGYNLVVMYKVCTLSYVPKIDIKES